MLPACRPIELLPVVGTTPTGDRRQCGFCGLNERVQSAVCGAISAHARPGIELVGLGPEA